MYKSECEVELLVETSQRKKARKQPKGYREREMTPGSREPPPRRRGESEKRSPQTARKQEADQINKGVTLLSALTTQKLSYTKAVIMQKLPLDTHTHTLSVQRCSLTTLSSFCRWRRWNMEPFSNELGATPLCARPEHYKQRQRSPLLLSEGPASKRRRAPMIISSTATYTAMCQVLWQTYNDTAVLF